VVYVENAPSGIVGLLAGNIKEAYNRPVIVFSEKVNSIGEKVWAGSARSIPEFNIQKALVNCSDLLITFGGHAMAAGMTIKPSEAALDELRMALNKSAAHLSRDILQPKIVWDVEIKANEITDDLLNEINILEPFGEGCRKPVLKMSVEFDEEADFYRIISEGKHVVFNNGGYAIMGFGQAKNFIALDTPSALSMVGCINENYYKGEVRPQFLISDLMRYNNIEELIKEALELVQPVKTSVNNPEILEAILKQKIYV